MPLLLVRTMTRDAAVAEVLRRYLGDLRVLPEDSKMVCTLHSKRIMFWNRSPNRQSRRRSGLRLALHSVHNIVTNCLVFSGNVGRSVGSRLHACICMQICLQPGYCP
nr:hypothetical protein CFP56_16595 [Quercus suber]